MNQGRCSHCRQSFCIRSKQPRRLRCPFCRVRLDPAPPRQLDDRPVLPHAFLPMPSATAGSFEPNRATYASIVDFIEERRQRLYSRERDVGLRWRHGEKIYRAAWIEDTRELYLVQLGTPDPVEATSSCSPPDWSSRSWRRPCAAGARRKTTGITRSTGFATGCGA